MTKYKLFPIDWSALTIGGMPVADGEGWMRLVKPRTQFKVGLCIEFADDAFMDWKKYRIFGYTDDEDWVEFSIAYPEHVFSYYATEPCDHIGNRKFAIGRLEE